MKKIIYLLIFSAFFGCSSEDIWDTSDYDVINREWKLTGIEIKGIPVEQDEETLYKFSKNGVLNVEGSNSIDEEGEYAYTFAKENYWNPSDDSNIHTVISYEGSRYFLEIGRNGDEKWMMNMIGASSGSKVVLKLVEY